MIRIQHAFVWERTALDSTIIVSLRHGEGRLALVETVIREGRSLPDAVLLRGDAEITDEFIVELHEALDEQTDLVEQEMSLLCD